MQCCSRRMLRCFRRSQRHLARSRRSIAGSQRALNFKQRRLGMSRHWLRRSRQRFARSRRGSARARVSSGRWVLFREKVEAPGIEHERVSLTILHEIGIERVAPALLCVGRVSRHPGFTRGLPGSCTTGAQRASLPASPVSPRARGSGYELGAHRHTLRMNGSVLLR
jgi:hypothetical protein